MLVHITKPASQTQPGRKKQEKSDSSVPTPLNKEIETLTWDEVIINEDTKSELIMLVELLKDPKASKRYGIETPKGVLLAGPPGTGKTTVAKIVANTAGLSFFNLRIDEVVSKWVGESEKNLSALFKAAQKHAPSLIFIDEVDSIGAQRSGEQHWSDNLLNHMLQLIDGVVKSEGVHVIAATNRPDLVDSALKRAGRLNRVIELPLPDKTARMRMFALYMSRLTLGTELDLDILSEVTKGKSGADIKAICNQAGLNAFKRESAQGSREYKVQEHDVRQALEDFLIPVEMFEKRDPQDPHSNYRPAAVKEGVEELGWDDVILNKETKDELRLIVELLKDPEAPTHYGIEVPRGVLLAGPPGTGKTTIAKILSHQAGLSFFTIGLDDIVSKWVGESEKNLSRLFQEAQKKAPSLIFIDEVDSIGAQRSGERAWSDNLLNHMLQLIDGVVKTDGLHIVAATNRPDLVDSALKRSGRLNKTIIIPIPDHQARKEMFDLFLGKMRLEEQFNTEVLAKITAGRSGADIRAICNQAGINAFQRESITGERNYLVSYDDMKNALSGFMT